MKRKLFIGTILLSIALLFSGCLNSDTPRDQPIILSKDSQTFDVVVRTDSSKVTWTLDGNQSRTDQTPEGSRTAHYLLEYKNIPVGNHVLKVEDSDTDLEWQIQVNGTSEEQAKNGVQNGDGHYPTWEEQQKAANEKNKK